MTRMTKDLRESIARKAVETQFKPRHDALKVEEHKLGMEMYNATFPADIQKQLKKIPDGWLRMDGCLRFNCGGYDLRFTVSPAVPVPYSTHCARLAAVTGDLAERGQAHANALKDFREQYEAAYRALLRMLESVGSVKALQKAWPDGIEFYKNYLTAAPGAAVPALRVEEVNKMLGLAA